MSGLMSAVRRQVEDFLSKTSRKQKIYFGIGVAAAVAMITILSLMLGQVEYVVLYTGLEESEAGEIMQRLDELGVEAKTQGSHTILVPSDNADEIRMSLAAQGYPETGLNYDIFGNASSLGTTDLQTQTYLQYQLQENVRSTILKLNRIEDCVVIFNIPSESLFVLSSDETEASASVMVEIEGGGTLTNEEVQAIAHLVLKSVSGLKLDNISIVDSAMNLYDVTAETEEEYSTTQYNLTQQTKDTYEQQVLSVLTPVFGKENVSAAVNVVLNFDQETVSSVAFDTPIEGEDNGLAVSMEELYEKTQGDGNAEGTAGTDSNGVALSEYVFEDAAIDDFQKISRTVNYELNELQTQIVKQQGSIEKLSVAVLLNSRLNDEDYSKSIISLVSKAIGVDEGIRVGGKPTLPGSGGQQRGFGYFQPTGVDAGQSGEKGTDENADHSRHHRTALPVCAAVSLRDPFGAGGPSPAQPRWKGPAWYWKKTTRIQTLILKFPQQPNSRSKDKNRKLRRQKSRCRRTAFTQLAIGRRNVER